MFRKTLRMVLFFILTAIAAAGCHSRDIIIYGSGLQTEIIMPEGERIFIDVISENFPSIPFTEKDILTVTFPGPDHYNPGVAAEFPGEKLLYGTGIIERDNFRVEMIPSARNSGDEIIAEGATNYMILIESEEWRILYCGDIGQDHFTKEQMDRIGKVDICFAPLENSYSNMTLSNKKGFNLIKELDPRIVIPLRYGERAFEYAMSVMPVFSSPVKPVKISEKQVPEQTSLLIIDDMAPVYHKLYDTALWRE